MTEPAKSMQTALADLRKRRQMIDDAIASMENIMREVYGISAATTTGLEQSSVTPAAASPKPPAPAPEIDAGATRADRVRSIIQSQPDRVWTVEDVAEGLGEQVDESVTKSLHSLFSRLSKSGELHKVGRGRYRFGPAPTAATDASAPEMQSGAEDQEERIESSPEEKGGGRDGTSTPLEDADRGDHWSLDGQHHRGDRALVKG